ncbi:hypothetical protein HPC49_21630 [Pyxidicoccus fallax]|uniref:SMI1/KNR4 family protein n=1 Tax=Pyxidicoccus fallax TaxID=394095 RepID=A0A848LHW9_9BACT|nr:hypothetical protein [Pyxidicoccus fallax]NMO16618.1 hypothetical protein [Pyxidicoccus fallax]NPC80813.1 hypothetical protein [Pyxidicoccus fallax]
METYEAEVRKQSGVDPGWLETMRPAGAEWRAYFEKRGSAQRPEDAPYADMISVFGNDGDLVLIARDGRVFGWRHDATVELAPLAASFDALLDVLDGRRANPLDFR